eukprot:TRINITY_DN5795_c0_g1_i1.p1 TRINITY_DN5795_c0_g1~~TRINITY_DN5795_c0_g1_i1.p1  ORF type:complete len:444 (-),score=101.15 TRINITY_DN5795_c0_g1_i1:69-1277(-)
MIGSGSFAVVYRGFWRKTEVAIKMIQQNAKKEKLTFRKETSLMFNLRHPNVVSLMGVVLTPRLCIVTEFCLRGDVGEMLLDPKMHIEPEHIRKICLDTCRGMTYLHGANVIHRDLKCRNLLIDKDWNIKVADFGLARGIEDKPGNMTACGTPTHAAPEVIRHSGYTQKADVYSFGICIWEMCLRKEPYETIPGFRVIVAVATKRMRPKIPTTLDPEWTALIRRCWAEEPDIRPNFTELVEIFEKMKLETPTKKMPFREEELSSREVKSKKKGESPSHSNSNHSPANTPKFKKTKAVDTSLKSFHTETEISELEPSKTIKNSASFLPTSERSSKQQKSSSNVVFSSTQATTLTSLTATFQSSTSTTKQNIFNTPSTPQNELHIIRDYKDLLSGGTEGYDNLSQ